MWILIYVCGIDGWGSVYRWPSLIMPMGFGIVMSETLQSAKFAGFGENICIII